MMDNGGINIVALGADPTGQIACDQYLVQAFQQSPLVYAPPGSFRVDGQMTPPSGSTLYGAGVATRFFKQGSGFSSAAIFSYSGVSGVTIRDMILDCGGFGASGIGATFSLNLRVLNVEVKNTHGAGIVAGNVADFYFDNITMNNIGRIIPASEGGSGQSTGGEHGLSLFDSVNGTIKGCHIEVAVAAGVNLGHCQQVTATANVVRKGGFDGAGWGGFRFSNQSSDITVTGNTIEGFTRAANFDGCKDITFNSNTCKRQSSDAIILRSGTLRDAQGNIVQPEHSSTCEGHEIVGNKIINPGDGSAGGVAGIWIYGTDGQANRDHVIVGNSVSNRNGKSVCAVRNWSGTSGDNILIGWNRGNVPEF